MSGLGDALAAGALVVSAIALAYSRRAMVASEAQAFAAKTQTRLATEEHVERRRAQQRAALRATMSRARRPEGGATGRITLHNDGEAVATDVRIGARQDESRGHPEVLRMAGLDGDSVETVFRHIEPVRRIAPKTPVHFPLVTSDWMAARYFITLTWTNADGSSGKWSSEVPIEYDG